VERNSRRQAWYIARHLKFLSGNLAKLGFSEAALLVGAAAISVGDEAVRAGGQSHSASLIESISLSRGNAVHG